MTNAELIGKLKSGTLDETDLEQFTNGITQKAVKEALRVLPQVIDHLVKQSHILHNMTKGFYKNNPELEKHRQLVAKTIERIEVDNPGMQYGTVLETAAVELKEKIKHLRDPKDHRKLDVKKLDAALGDL